MALPGSPEAGQQPAAPAAGQSASPQPGQQAPGGGQPAGQQAQEPGWLHYVPEAERQQARDGWLRHEDYTKKTQEYSTKQKEWETEREGYKPLQQQVQEYNTWLQGQWAPFVERLRPHWDEINAWLTARANGQQQQLPAGQQAPAGPASFEHWDVMRPQEQAQAMANYLGQGVITQGFQRLAQHFEQVLKQKEGFYENYLRVLTDGFSRKLQDPSLDLNQYMATALKFTAGQFNPMEMAYQSMTSGAERQKLIEEARKQGRADYELELKNQQQTPTPTGGHNIPQFKTFTPQNGADLESAVRQKFAQQHGAAAW